MTTPTFPEVLLTQIRQAGIIATLTIDDAKDADPLARALSAGGVDCLELTLRTATALDALRRIREEVPQITIGAGTILTPRQVNDCAETGVAFGVAPGMNPSVAEEARRVGLPFAPGICTPSDIESALEVDCTLLTRLLVAAQAIFYERALPNWFGRPSLKSSHKHPEEPPVSDLHMGRS